MANPQRGAGLWEHVAQTLNSIIVDTQQAIDINNRLIWDTILHVWSNQDWLDVLAIAEYTRRCNPDIATDFNVTALLNARMVLDTGQPRALDKRATKRHAWAAIMTLREMYNKLEGIRIANAPAQQAALINQFDAVFEQTQP